jgi:hypothetical protein
MGEISGDADHEIVIAGRIIPVALAGKAIPIRKLPARMSAMPASGSPAIEV